MIKSIVLALDNHGQTFGRGVLEYETVDIAKEALESFKTNPVVIYERRVHFTFSKMDRESIEKRNAKVLLNAAKTKKKERKARISFLPRKVKR